jgi:hypothetical protein
MTTDRDKLTTFFYLLTQRVGWHDLMRDISDAALGKARPSHPTGAAALAEDLAARLLGPDATGAEPALDPGWPSSDDERIKRGRFIVPVGALGYLDAEAIIAHDLQRPVPASPDVHACIRAIADKPHKAPQLIGDLLDQARSESETRAPSRVDRERRETLLAAAEMLSELRSECTLTVPRLSCIAELIDRCNLAAIADGGVVRSEPEHEPKADLRTMASRWLDAGREYWHALGDEFGRRAVVWCDDTSGALTIYTRGEYADQLRAAIPTDGGQTHVFDQPEPERGPWVVRWVERDGSVSTYGYWSKETASKRAYGLKAVGFADVLVREATASEHDLMRNSECFVSLHEAKP